MKSTLVALLLSLAACSTDPDPVDDTDPAVEDDTDPGATDDTDPGDTDTDGADDTDDTDPGTTDDTWDANPPADTDGGGTWYHAILELEIAPAGQGFDVDGDGLVDNALGPLAGALNPLIAANYGSNFVYGVTQLWGVDNGDDLADIGVLAAYDVDEDPADNTSGTEDMEALVALEADGHAPLYAHTRLSAQGRYRAALPPGLLALGPFAFPVATEIHVLGTVNATDHGGLLGGAVLVDDVIDILDTLGLGWAGALVRQRADIDLDQDGTPEAVSMAFTFSGPSIVLTPMP